MLDARVVTVGTLAQMTWRYGKEHPCQCRFCKKKIKVGDRILTTQRISLRTAWFRKYVHESCYEKSLGCFVPLLLDGNGPHG